MVRIESGILSAQSSRLPALIRHTELRGTSFSWTIRPSLYCALPSEAVSDILVDVQTLSRVLSGCCSDSIVHQDGVRHMIPNGAFGALSSFKRGDEDKLSVSVYCFAEAHRSAV